MQVRKWAVSMSALLATLAGITLGFTVVPAQASSQICGNGGSGYCLNDWGNGGSGNAVKMYNGGVANDNFYFQPVNACDGGSVILSDCASAWGAQGGNLVGASITRVKYINSGPGYGLCVGTNSSGDAIMAACGDDTGSGAGNGVIMAFIHNETCNTGSEAKVVDRYWSKQYGVLSLLESGGNVGVQAFLNYSDADTATCWG